MRYLHQLGIAIDQLFNALIGGMADETLSARSWRHREERPYIVYLLNGIFFWQENHCKESYESEVQRKQLPQEYQGG